ncbi:hypothetical protein AAC387_Pa10g1538 [Persea americana]
MGHKINPFGNVDSPENIKTFTAHLNLADNWPLIVLTTSNASKYKMILDNQCHLTMSSAKRADLASAFPAEIVLEPITAPASTREFPKNIAKPNALGALKAASEHRIATFFRF